MSFVPMCLNELSSDNKNILAISPEKGKEERRSSEILSSFRNNSQILDIDTEQIIEKLNEESNLPCKKGKKRFNALKNLDKKLSKNEEHKIKKIFKNIFVFDFFPENIIDFIISNLFVYEMKQGELLYRKESQSSCFYIVFDGELEAYDNSTLDKDGQPFHKVFVKWDYFGENALISKSQLNTVKYSIHSRNPSTLLVLKGETFLTIKQKITNLRLEERFAFLNKILIFKSLDCIQKNLIADRMEFKVYENGRQILRIGNEGKAIY